MAVDFASEQCFVRNTGVYTANAKGEGRKSWKVGYHGRDADDTGDWKSVGAVEMTESESRVDHC